MPLFTTGNSAVDDAAGAALGGLFNRVSQRVGLTPNGAASPQGQASMDRPVIAGSPNQPQTMPAGTRMASWAKKPIVLVVAVVVVVALGWALLRKRR